MRAIVASALVLAHLGCGGGSDPVDRILLVTIDTIRAERFGYMGYDVATPNLDRLAREGAAFTQAVTAVPMTLPSHSTILTGLYPLRHGVRDNGVFQLEEEVETIAETFKAAGFATGAFVGAFVLDRRYGLNQGFDRYDDEVPAENPVHGIYYPERRAEEVVSSALEWIEERRDERFFAWVHLFDPHGPHDAPSPFAEQYPGRDYDAEVAYTDFALGPLFETMGNDSAILVVGDHGEGLDDHGESTHSLFVYDSTMRVPMILKAPGIPAGRRVEEQVRTVDVAPTLLELAGLEVKGDLDGISLVRHLQSGEVPTLHAYGETFGTRFQFNWSELRFLRAERFKLIDAPRPELYDLDADPGETRNLWSESPPEVGKRLYRRLEEMKKQDGPVTRTVEVDEETARKLESLGYVTSNRSLTDDVELPDPKDRVEVFEQLQLLLSPELSVEEQIDGYRDILALEPTNLMARSRFANALAMSDRLEEAVEEYQELLNVSEIDAGGWDNLVSALLLLGRVDEALVVTERAIAETPWFRELYVLRGEALENAGRLEDALQAYAKAVELRPEIPDNHWRHGTVALKLGDESRAERDFRESLTRDPDFEQGRVALARLLASTGRAEEAVTLVSREGGAEQKIALAEAYLAQERFEEAKGLLEQALTETPDNARALALLGPIHGRVGELDEAARALEKSIELGNDDADIRRNLALVFLRQGRGRAAATHLEAATKREPEQPTLWFTLGNVYLQTGQYGSAVVSFEKALNLRPDWPEATFNLALAYERTGATRKAADAFRRFLEGEGASDTERKAIAAKSLAALEK